MDIASPERHEVLGELTFREGSIKVQCNSSTRRRSSSRRRRHGTTSSSCRVLPTAMSGTENDSTSSGARYSCASTTMRRRTPATCSHGRCRSGRRPSVSSSNRPPVNEAPQWRARDHRRLLHRQNDGGTDTRYGSNA